MTAHDPRVTLTEAEIERLCDALEDCDAEYRVEQRVARVVERIIAARLAPIRALADEWQQDIDDRREDTPEDDGSWPIIRAQWIGHIAGLGDALNQLRAALDAPLSTSQDHDGAEGQGEGEKAGERRRCPTCGIPFAHYTHDPQGRPL